MQTIRKIDRTFQPYRDAPDDRRVDVLDGVPVNPYDPEAFQLDRNGRMDYTGPGVTTMQGVDISAFQGEIDWDKVKDDGVDFAQRMAEIHRELLELQAESNGLMETISRNLKEMGL